MPFFGGSSGGSGGTPGGTSGQVQYNNAGSFDGLTGLTLSAGALAAVAMAGALSAASWGLSGVGLTETARTITDTSSAGTVASGATHALGGNTIAAANARTVTDYYSLYLKDAVAGSNVTFTNKWTLGLEGGALINGQARLVGPSANFKSLLLVANGGSASNAYGFSVTTSAMTVYLGNSALYVFDGGNFNFRSDGSLAWSSTTSPGGTADLFAGRSGAAAFRHGAADAASPVAQTIGVQNVVAGTSNTAGPSVTWRAGAGTGTGTAGGHIFQTAPPGSSGTSQNSWVNRLTLDVDNYGAAALDTMQLARGTNAQTSYFYATTSSANVNYERFAIRFNGTRFVLDTQAGGTGTTRELVLAVGGSTVFQMSAATVYSSSNFNDINNGVRDLGVTGAIWRNCNLGGALGVGVVAAASPTAMILLGAATTAKAHLNLTAGVAPTSPNNGDIWFDGTDVKVRVGGVTKTVTLT